MNWDAIESLKYEAIHNPPSDLLVARQLGSEGRNPYYKFLKLYSEIQRFSKGILLEIGCWRGCLAAHLSFSDPLIHIGIDLNPVNFSHPNFFFIQGDSTEEKIANQVKAVSDFYGGVFAVFQDSSHHYAESVREWELYSPLLRPGGIWVADDITPAFKRPDEPRGMVDYWNDLPGDKRLYSDLHVGSMVGILRKE